jgi:hypothetical protein
LLGAIQTREYTLDLEELRLPESSKDLQDMDAIFSEEEISGVIKELPPDHAPGPDCFVGAFYQRAWPIIKGDIMAAVYKLYVIAQQSPNYAIAQEGGCGRTRGHQAYQPCS